jgi:ATP-dependent Clp protease protease subunit
VVRDTDRDFFMTAKEACDYGLVDEVVQSRKAPRKKSKES